MLGLGWLWPCFFSGNIPVSDLTVLLWGPGMDDLSTAPGMDDLSTAPDDTLMPGIGMGRGGDDAAVAGDAPSPVVPRRGFQARLAERRDREPARAILKQLHARIVFRAQVFADGKVDRMFDRVLARQPGMVGIVAEHDGAPVGIAWATADEYLLSDGPLFVTVHVVAIDLTLNPFRRAKAFLTLVTAIRQWAAAQGASPVFFHVMTGVNLAGTDRLMRASGAQCVGGVMWFDDS